MSLIQKKFPKNNVYINLYIKSYANSIVSKQQDKVISFAFMNVSLNGSIWEEYLIGHWSVCV